LGTQEIGFIEEAVAATFAELPRERFVVESVRRDEAGECADSCQLNLAKERGAHRIVLGSISAFGNWYVAIFKLYDTETGQPLASASTNAKGTLEELIGETKQTAFVLRDRLAPVVFSNY
jgi:hypothetical protein